VFGNGARSDASTEGKAPRRGREGRGLGPFTSGHLALIIVTVVVVAGFPFAAGAVGSAMNIVDATSGAQAKVDSGHNLHAAIGDPGGVNVAKVNGIGQQLVTGPVTVSSGNVNATPRPINNWFRTTANTPGTTKTVLIGPGGLAGAGATGYVITQINVDFWQVTTTGANEQIDFWIASNSSNNCTNFGSLAFDVNPAGVGLVAVPFNPGLHMGTTSVLCAATTDGTNINADVSVYGYVI
jgi:hypothetical protein